VIQNTTIATVEEHKVKEKIEEEVKVKDIVLVSAKIAKIT
jgi:hypothetical protein